jgi:hypothetical protein
MGLPVRSKIEKIVHRMSQLAAAVALLRTGSPLTRMRHKRCLVKSRVLPEMRVAGEPLELIQTEEAQYKLE